MSEYKIRPMIEELSNPPGPSALFETLRDRPYSFFLDSVSQDEKSGRYSFMGCDPFLVFKSKGSRASFERPDGRVDNISCNPFSALAGLFDKYKTEINPAFPFTSGGVGYLSYDLKGFVEDLADTAEDDLLLPDSLFGFYDVVLIYDNMEGRAYIASSGLPEEGVRNIVRRASERLKHFKSILSTAKDGIFPGVKFDPPAVKSNYSKASYLEAVRRAKEYIRRGEIYQVNLSQRFEAAYGGDPFDLYLRLRSVSPAPFAAYLNFRDAVILSSSPERFLLKRGDRIETCPIKGTRPRGRDDFSDSELEKELAHSTKDRAEHLMIVDLERSDLGRVSKFGTVDVERFAAMEKYSNVFHLVSTVSGRLRDGVGPMECLLAAFPGGSITGAPKIRAMQIIEELEPVKRSVYTGAIGYISFDGNMDTSIVIRTFVLKGGKAYFQAGGGIVADSDPEREYDETIDKVGGLLMALGIEDPKKKSYATVGYFGGIQTAPFRAR